MPSETFGWLATFTDSGGALHVTGRTALLWRAGDKAQQSPRRFMKGEPRDREDSTGRWPTPGAFVTWQQGRKTLRSAKHLPIDFRPDSQSPGRVFGRVINAQTAGSDGST
jgi:hypothetical protein